MMDKETWLNAKQCKAEGFVNSIGKKDNNLPKNTLEALNEMQIGSIPDSITNHVQIKNNNMKKVTIALGLPENATEEQIEAAVKALQTTVENAAVNIAVAKGFEPEKAKTLAKTMHQHLWKWLTPCQLLQM